MWKKRFVRSAKSICHFIISRRNEMKLCPNIASNVLVMVLKIVRKTNVNMENALHVVYLVHHVRMENLRVIVENVILSSNVSTRNEKMCVLSAQAVNMGRSEVYVKNVTLGVIFLAWSEIQSTEQLKVRNQRIQLNT